MKEEDLAVLQQNWAKIGKHRAPSELEFELELYKKMLSVFQVGRSFYFVFVPSLGMIDVVSNSITSVLGYEPEEFTIELMLSIIHPDDLPYFMDFELAVVDFKMKLPKEKLMKYKTRYNYRVKRKDGVYIHILQQSITIETNDEGAVLRNLVIHTDIDYLKTTNKKTLSFIGLEGEESFYDVKVDRKYSSKQAEVLTRREKQILLLLSKNKSSEEIAQLLSISLETVKTHRRNINAKVGVSSPLELVTKATENGWL